MPSWARLHTSGHLAFLSAFLGMLPAGQAAASSGATDLPPAGITRVEITSIESPAFEGRAFGDVGAYEKLKGRAYGEVDPADPRNQVITDLQLAPRNERGRVAYSMDIYILRPVDQARGNGKLFMEVNNRGRKLFGPFNRSAGGNDPASAADAGDAFLLHQGYSLAWSGWDPSAPPGKDQLRIDLPVARQPDGSPITGPVYEYVVQDGKAMQTHTLSYPAAERNTARARLTVRERLNDTPVVLGDDDWEFQDENAIRLLPPGTAFRQSAIYELSYVARDPVVAGLGFAATRDFVSFLRYAETDGQGNANPLKGHVQRVHAFTVSQPGRFMNDFVWLGFNEDVSGRKVFDGIQNWIAAGTGVALNVRFAQPARTERNRQQHLYPEGIFPFAYSVLPDQHTDLRDGRNARCMATGTCPKVMMVNSANEYWVKAASLLHTDAFGRDIPDPDNVRFYLLAGTEHSSTGSPAGSRGICAQPRNPIDPNPVLRALFVALDKWLDGVPPPPSQVPRMAEGTAAPIEPTVHSSNGVGRVAAQALGWPDIPDVSYSGVATIRQLLDFGPRLAQGILDINPPRATGKFYPAFVSKVDEDGNETAGIRLPPVAAPLATYTGWALRAEAFGGPDGCESFGQAIPFAPDQQARQSRDDPRLSLLERYGSHAGYVEAVRKSAVELERRGLLLPEDTRRYIDEAKASQAFEAMARD